MGCANGNKDIIAGRLRYLLATSSVAALLLGGGGPSAFAATPCGANGFNGVTQAGISNSAAITCIFIANSTINGNVTNTGAGTITATSAGSRNGITINNSTINGAIVNAGSIAAPNGTGIMVQSSATVSGGISNAGTISAAGGSGIALMTINTFGGGITNTGTIFSGAGTAAIHMSGSLFTGGISNAGTLTVHNTGVGIFVNVSTFTGGLSNTGNIAGGVQGIHLASVSSFGGGIVNSGGMVTAQVTAIRLDTVSRFSGGITNNAAIAGNDIGIFIDVASTFSGGITNTGVLSGGTNALGLLSVSSFSGGILNTGAISSPNGNGIGVQGVQTFSGNVSNAGTITAKTAIKVLANVSFAAGSAIVNSGVITGSQAAIDVSAATSPVTIDQTGGAVNGAIKLSSNADVLNISGGAVSGNIVGAGASDTINFALGSGAFIYNSAFTGINQVNIDSGTVVLNGANSATNVDVIGGKLAGSGTIDPTVVTIHSGATFAPGTPGVAGTSMTIVGSLAFQSGAVYLTTLSSGTASFANVSGTASLNGIVQSTIAGGISSKTTFDVLHAGSISGTFAGFSSPNFTGALTYTSTDVLLNLTGATLGAGSNLNQNQQSVANALNNVFDSGGVLPANFASIFNLTGGSLGNALSQLDGEDATGAEHAASQLTNEFLTLMLDPFVNGRGYAPGSPGGGALGFAPDRQEILPPDIALAYASILKAPPKQNFDQRWNAWGSAYGGSSNADGNAVTGSNNVGANTYGLAAGLDYHLWPNTTVGFALAGAGTNWNLANALGSGRSDALQAGAYGITWFGPAYLAGALSFSNHWFTTDRTALGDPLRANFVGQSYGVRVESGYRTAVLASVGVTPYGAVQFQDFHTPAYSETDLTGVGFGLSYNAMNATDVRTELGSRFDAPTLFYGKPLILYGRVAWAHDFVSNPSLSAVFETLPGAGFTVFGAAIPHDSALTTAGAQLFMTANWSLIAKFDGEFAGGSQTYAGSGMLRYAW